MAKKTQFWAAFFQKIGACGAEKVGLETALESCTLGGGGGSGLEIWAAGWVSRAGWLEVPLG